MATPDLKSIFCKAEAILKGEEQVHTLYYPNATKGKWTYGHFVTNSEEAPAFCAIGALGAAIAILEDPEIVLTEDLLEDLSSSPLVQAASREFLFDLAVKEQKKVLKSYGDSVVRASNLIPAKTMEEFLVRYDEMKDDGVMDHLPLSDIVIDYNDSIAMTGRSVVNAFNRACVKLSENSEFLETGSCS